MIPAEVFEVGKLYSLDQIAHLTTRFKSKADLNMQEGLFHLYFDANAKSYWIGGPFQGKSSNFFLYVGTPSSDAELKTTLSKLEQMKKLRHADTRAQTSTLDNLVDIWTYNTGDSFGGSDDSGGFGDFGDSDF